MNQHKKVERMLAIYDELSDHERQQVDCHLDSCSLCSATLDAYCVMDQSLAAFTERLTHRELALAPQMATHPQLGNQRAYSDSRVPIEQPTETNWLRQLVQWRMSSARLVGGALCLLLLLFATSGWLLIPLSNPIAVAATPTMVSVPVPTQIETTMSIRVLDDELPDLNNVTMSPAPPAPTERIDYGVSTLLQDDDAISNTINATNDLGFNWIRTDLFWKDAEPREGQVDFSHLTGVITQAHNANIHVLVTISAAPDWAREVGFDGREDGPPADPQTLATFAGRIAQEYCGTSLKAIEIWSEQNLHYAWGNQIPSVDAYMDLLVTTATAIKEACPIMAVISGGLTPAGTNPPQAMDNLIYFGQMIESGLLAHVDGVGVILPGFNVPPNVRWEEACDAITDDNVHFTAACDSPHHSWSFLSTLEAYEERLASAESQLSIPIWVTEFGWAAGEQVDARYTYVADNTREEQAEWTVQAFRLLAEHNTGPAFVYNLDGRVVEPNSAMAQWGIVDEVWNPLPVYDALRQSLAN